MKNTKMAELRGTRSLREVAKELDIPYSTYAMIETGHRFPRKELAMKLSNFYGVTVDELFFAHNDHETRPDKQTA
ncbi:helix-turn-helix transcriptional regulator [Paenibacillus harenae]|uniref:helix-turn-helix transcriptional regulator n=1 Tax=Paenibacillus harenae TaxID=306543 RepID=UPI002794E5D3|nr:helix-turn-helix transcriptional regulator [Paenibacillus harenae]MDQ0062330.1 putative transcriptional regulator [Paenibacillus harenae]